MVTAAGSAQAPTTCPDWVPDAEAEQYERDLDVVLGLPWWDRQPVWRRRR